MAKLKLVVANKVNDTLCCNSQMYQNRDTCDFCVENGELFNWNGNGWTKSDLEFEIVDKITIQKL